MLFKMNKVSVAVLVFLGLASSSTMAQQYQNEGPEIRYEPSSNSSRPAAVSSAISIQGCNAGLMVLSGVYTCRSTILVSQGGTIPDPVVYSSSSGGGRTITGYLGSDGVTIYSGPNEDSSTVLGTTADTSYNNTTNERDAANSSDTGSTSNSSGGGGSSRVICTHFFARGEIPKDVWRADLAYTKENLSETTVRGYHSWAIGYVKLMRKSKLAEDIMRPIALHRARELAYQMGVVEKGSWRGKLARLALEPLCFAIGTCVGARDYMALWKDQPHVLKLVEAQSA
nr:hypothetical protein [uncultured Rhodoferax sp.]